MFYVPAYTPRAAGAFVPVEFLLRTGFYGLFSLYVLAFQFHPNDDDSRNGLINFSLTLFCPSPYLSALLWPSWEQLPIKSAKVALSSSRFQLYCSFLLFFWNIPSWLKQKSRNIEHTRTRWSLGRKMADMRKNILLKRYEIFSSTDFDERKQTKARRWVCFWNMKIIFSSPKLCYLPKTFELTDHVPYCCHLNRRKNAFCFSFFNKFPSAHTAPQPVAVLW